ncbi:hypothetical protein [Francisella tularensis]|uniref:hypothetical protein n=1 Tax=Francisella tularensis TaxID=263 RepID=UPI001749C861|nr:hypothetical protein [Francisella tularensis]MBD5784281.1 hypothetical protein [Francisella tularensis subsp. holarctica]
MLSCCLAYVSEKIQGEKAKFGLNINHDAGFVHLLITYKDTDEHFRIAVNAGNKK